MPKNIFFMAAVLLLAACSEKRDISVEEHVITNLFGMSQSALVYDEVCNDNDTKDRYDNLDRKQNINLIGNEQMLAARLGGLLHVRAPEKTVDEIVEKMVDASQKIKDKTRKILSENGCDASEVAPIKKGYDLFSSQHPAAVYGFVDREIEKRGGTITSVDEIEAAGTPEIKNGVKPYNE